MNSGYFYAEGKRCSKDFNNPKTIKNLAFEMKDGKLKISE